MLRRFILWLSRNRLAERAASGLPGVRSFSHRFVAGQTQADALDAIAQLNADGFEATVSYLGEAVESEEKARAAAAELASLAREARARGLRSGVSVKLTQLGLAFDRRLAEELLGAVVDAAREAGSFVRIDMEDSRYTQATLEIFERVLQAHAGVGVVIQAYLRRSRADIEALAAADASVRLVKGAYREPASVALQSKAEVDAAYVDLVEAYFDRAQTARLAIATHDVRIVRAALASTRRRGLVRERFEFQMLYGIRTGLQRTLRDRGYIVRVYVPYGTHWYPYLMRRLAERPANLWFFLSNAVRG